MNATIAKQPNCDWLVASMAFAPCGRPATHKVQGAILPAEQPVWHGHYCADHSKIMAACYTLDEIHQEAKP